MRTRVTAVTLLLVAAGACLAQGQPATTPAPATPPAVVEPAKADAPAAKATKKDTLTLGDKAPELKIEKWVKGEPVSSFKAGEVYVVEFWATWCGPCRASIPHLSELQAKMKDKKVTVIGISSQERKGLSDVEPFVTKMGDKMAYTVAWDEKGKTNTAYMEASGQEGIPTAFVVNQEGKIAWIGHPMDGLDGVLEQVASGKYDIAKAAAEAKKKADMEAKTRPHLEAFEAALGTGEFEKAIASLDKALAIDPAGLSELSMAKFQILAVNLKQLDKAYAYAKEVVDGTGKDNAQLLNGIAWTILDEEGITRRDLPLAKRAAERANELTKGKDPAILDTFARALFDTGEKDRAIQVQTKAVELAPEGAMKDELSDRLKDYAKRAGKG